MLDSTRGGGQNFGIFSKNAFFIGLTFVMHYGKQDFGFETYLFIAHNWWLLDGKLLFFDRKWGWGVLAGEIGVLSRFGIAFSGSTLGFQDGFGRFIERNFENFKSIAEKN